MPDRIPSLRQIDHHANEGVRIYRNNEDDDYPAHWHMSYEVINPVDNIYTVLVEGTSYELYPGDVMIIPSGTVHELFAPVSGLRYFLLIDRDRVTSISGMNSAEHCFYPCMHIVYDQSKPANRRVCEAAFAAVREHENGGALSDAAVMHHVGLMLIEAARLRMNGGGTIPAGDLRRTQQQILFSDICAYISAHCSEHLTPEEIAEKSGYSRFHFGRLFASFAGVNFHDYLLMQRINMAKRLLYSTTLSVTEVAMQSGFGSIATFNRVFMGHEDMSPTEYRTLRQGREK